MRRAASVALQRAVQFPADHAPRVGIQNHRQVDELHCQPDVGDVGPPELIDAGQRHLSRQVRIHPQRVIGVRGHHEFPFPQAQQVVFAHQPLHALAVHRPLTPLQFRGDPPAAIRRPLQRDLLDLVAQF
jgi:hypothetical protein